MKKNNMILCAAILFTCYIVFPRLLKKQSPYPKWWDREADEALEQVKNFLQETKNDLQ
jgi:hypothetical protein